MKQVAKYMVVFLLWNGVAGAFLLFGDPLTGLPFALALSALYFWGYLLRRPAELSPRRRWAFLRLGALRGGRLRWSLIAVPVLLVLSWAMGDVYTRIVPVPAESLNPFESIMATAGGRLAITIFAVAVAPLVEEFVFRGLIQRTLERRFGAATGIAGAAALFAVIHLLPWVFPLHFFLGLAFGFAVYATRSIWSGVLLHAANNSAAMIGATLGRDEAEAIPTLWEIGLTAELWLSVLLLVASSFAALWAARGLLDSGRQTSLRSA
ncbi:MAG TPA: type II CAAX endopeptidase family protein [Longimicrobiaceae bacterium]|nr:type II CAAX endopeptidase family protein [Longimicrobiaceae bacterium]